jgi:hypothetical protein
MCSDIPFFTLFSRSEERVDKRLSPNSYRDRGELSPQCIGGNVARSDSPGRIR